MMTVSILSRCDFGNYQISAHDSVGIAGDDIMYHILVLFVSINRQCLENQDTLCCRGNVDASFLLSDRDHANIRVMEEVGPFFHQLFHEEL